MALAQAVFLLLSLTLVVTQRPSYAGTRPIGYPVLQNKTTTTADGLGNRFGEDATTQKLPLEALGDKDLVDRLSKFPEDKQYFWLLNAQALEANRQKPQVYPQRPNFFAQPLNPQTVNSASSTSATISLPGNRGASNSVPEDQKPNSQLRNKFSESSSATNINSEFTAQPMTQNFINDKHKGNQNRT